MAFRRGGLAIKTGINKKLKIFSRLIEITGFHDFKNPSGLRLSLFEITLRPIVHPSDETGSCGSHWGSENRESGGFAHQARLLSRSFKVNSRSRSAMLVSHCSRAKSGAGWSAITLCWHYGEAIRRGGRCEPAAWIGKVAWLSEPHRMA